jgi:hypothetical protein
MCTWKSSWYDGYVVIVTAEAAIIPVRRGGEYGRNAYFRLKIPLWAPYSQDEGKHREWHQ